MLWLETLSSFGSSFIGHGLPRGCNGAVSTLYLGRCDQGRDSRLHLGFGLGSALAGSRSDVVGLICAGSGSEVGQINK